MTNSMNRSSAKPSELLDELYATMKTMKKAMSTAERLSLQYRVVSGDMLPDAYIDYMHSVIMKAEGLAANMVKDDNPGTLIRPEVRRLPVNG